MPLSLQNLNSTAFVPESKDEDLHSGWLQLPKGSVCVVSELELEEGTIAEKGASLLLCSKQKLLTRCYRNLELAKGSGHSD